MKDRLKDPYKTKGVTFNLEDPDQLLLYKYAMKRKNFSGYMKRLIQRDLEAQKKPDVNRTTTGGIKVDLS